MLDNTAWYGYTVGGGDRNGSNCHASCLFRIGCCIYFDVRWIWRVVIEMTMNEITDRHVAAKRWADKLTPSEIRYVRREIEELQLMLMNPFDALVDCMERWDVVMPKWKGVEKKEREEEKKRLEKN